MIFSFKFICLHFSIFTCIRVHSRGALSVGGGAETVGLQTLLSALAVGRSLSPEPERSLAVN